MSDIEEQDSKSLSTCGWSTAGDQLHRAVELFLFEEAELLDTWRLHEWLDLFTQRGVYMIPSTDKPDGDPDRDLFLVHDDRFLLEQRVESLLTRAAHAEYPHSRTRRLVSNVRVQERSNCGEVDVRANFAVFRMRFGAIDTYVGHYEHLLIQEPGVGFRFLRRRSVLDLEALRPHGKVSIIL